MKPNEILYTITPSFPKGSPLYKEYKVYFDAVVNYIRQSSVFYDPHSKIEIKEDEIHFGHPLYVIENILPQLRKLFGFGPWSSFKEYNLTDCVLSVCVHPHYPLKEAQKELDRKAKEYFSHLSQPSPPRVDSSVGLTNATELLLKCLQENEGLAIGEIHSDGASKKILIDNMARLKNAGVDTIFLEHIPDTLNAALIEYYSSPSDEMPLTLKQFLVMEDKKRSRSYGLPGSLSHYNFTNLVVSAKRNRIKIVPFDSGASYETTGEEGDWCLPDEISHVRELRMNYLAAQAFQDYEKKPHGKYIFFVGSAHINQSNSRIPGVTEITGCPTFVVEDKRPDREFISEITNGADHLARPDFVITLDPTDVASPGMKQLHTLVDEVEESREHKVSRQISSVVPGSGFMLFPLDRSVEEDDPDDHEASLSVRFFMP